MTLVFSACGESSLEPGNSYQADASQKSACVKSEHNVTYSLDWNWGEASPLESKPGWTVLNNLGYRIEVETAYLVTYRTGLVTCEESDLLDTQRENSFGSCMASKWTWTLFSNAHAGHSFTDDDPVVITTPHVENLAQPSSLSVGTVSVSDQKYCRLHYLIARAEREAVGLPNDVALVDSSLYVAGHYFLPDSDDPVSFSILSNAADGALVDIGPATSGTDQTLGMIQVAFEGANISIVRQLDRMWDEVNFVSMSERDIARQVVGNITSSVNLEIIRTP
jgi:hypothetical protein